jgi:DNA mismatch repair ATPase MutS
MAADGGCVLGGGGSWGRYAELRGLVQGLAVLDCLFSLARVAKRGGWVRPEMQRGAHVVDIVGGRHPMVEATIGDRYVPNDVRLSHDAQARRLPPARGKSGGRVG